MEVQMADNHKNKLYLRSGGVRYREDVSTSCLASLTLFVYLSCANMEFEIHDAGFDDVPHFQSAEEGNMLDDEEDILMVDNRELQNIFRQLRTTIDLDSFLDHAMVLQKFVILNLIRTIRQAALFSFYGGSNEFAQKFDGLKTTLEIEDDDQIHEIQDSAIAALNSLSRLIWWNKYFFKGMVDGVLTYRASMVDAMFVSTGLFILKALPASQLNLHLQTLPNLCTLIDQFGATKMARKVARIDCIGLDEGTTSVVKQCQMLGIVPQGTYAVKIPKTDEAYYSVWMESIYLTDLQYPNVMQIVAFGKTEHEKGFMVSRLYQSNLMKRLDGLDWRTTVKIIKQVVYTVNLIYSHYAPGQRLILCDLTPMNILMDENDNAIICDLGSCSVENTVTNMCTIPYVDTSQMATPQKDIYSIRSLMIRLLTTEEPGVLKEEHIRAGIEKIIRPNLLTTGCNIDTAMVLVDHALLCRNEKGEERPPLHEVLSFLWQVTSHI